MRQFKTYLILCILLLPLFAVGQQNQQFNQYFFNPLSINPAYAGSRGMLSAVAIHRSQWVGFKGAPTTESFSIHTPSRNKKMGFGFQIQQDKIGPKKTTMVSGIYAYSVQLGIGRLAYGLRASLYNYKFNWDEIDYQDKTASGFESAGTESYLTPSFDVGLYYSDRLNYIGLEITHLNQGKLGVQGDNVNLDFANRQKAQLNLTAGRAIKINRNLVFKPSILVSAAKNLPLYLDVTASFLLKNKLWLGASYRKGYGAAIIAEYKINQQFRVGYSYDLALTELIRQNAGSHEISISYDFNIFQSRTVSSRYF